MAPASAAPVITITFGRHAQSEGNQRAHRYVRARPVVDAQRGTAGVQNMRRTDGDIARGAQHIPGRYTPPSRPSHTQAGVAAMASLVPCALHRIA